MLLPMKKFPSISSIFILLVAFLVTSYSKDKDFLLSDDLNRSDAAVFKGAKTGEYVLSDIELLGKAIFFDKISIPNKTSCADCHEPEYGFTGPDSGQNLASGIYRGAVSKRTSNRKPPVKNQAIRQRTRL